MSLVTDALVNLWRLLRNAYVRLLKRPPDYAWIEVSGSLPEFESRVGFLQRRLRPGPTGPSLEKIRDRLARVLADGRPRGVILRVRSLDAGWAVLEELRRELFAFRGRGGRFVRNDFSRESREQAERLLQHRYEELVGAIAQARNLTPEEARARIDRAPYGPSEALAEGLLDGVCYEDELRERLGREGERARLAEWGAAHKSLRVPYRRSSRRQVGLVSLSGTIVRGKSRKLPVPVPLVGGEQAGSESVVAALRLAERNRRVSAIIFHVESPGGDALASDLIWREVERIRNKKPVVVLMGNAAASGGYYVSAAANHVVARRTTITGSIGVLSIRPVAEGLYEKLGVHPAAVERGARAGLLDLSRRPTPDELRVLQGQIRFIYDEFKDRVSRGRSMETEDLEGIAAGRVWTGTEAHELGLADEIGGFGEALRKARELGKIERAGPEVLLKVSAPRSGRPAPGDPAEAAREMVGEVKQALSELGASRVWAVAPYEISEG